MRPDAPAKPLPFPLLSGSIIMLAVSLCTFQADARAAGQTAHRSVDSIIKELGTAPWPEHPRPDRQREDWENLNGVWEFSFDPGDKGQGQKWREKHTLGEKKSETGNWCISELPPKGPWKPYGAGPLPTAAAFLERYRDLFTALMREPECAGFTSVQLYDVEGEVNGYLTYDRKPKIPPEAVRSIHADGLRRRAGARLHSGVTSRAGTGPFPD